MKKILALFLVLVVVIAGIAEWGYAVYTRRGPAAAQGKETVVTIRAGIGLRGIARALKSAGVITDEDVFMAGARITGKAKALKAGDYAIASGASMKDIAGQIAEGRVLVYKVTIAEGLTSRMAVDIIGDNPALTGDKPKTPEEGSLLPETYLFRRGTTRAEILAQMQKDRDELLDRLWQTRAKGLPFKTKREAVIMASVVEKETSLPHERRHIASVFINRLRSGMKLQSDPTIIYGITKGYPLGRGIRESEIHAASPFNTYVVPGLPAGPICNPGRDALAAVLDPADTRDLYFVADGSGGHAFAATIEDQVRNVRRWRKIEKQQKSK